ncbi:MAG TPA: AEC family transporter [Methanocorpusculum sp.]|nr:AEC family transporter [Methanocorpusculum sp.]
MDILFSINNVLILLLLVIVGYVVRKINVIPAAGMPILSKFLLYFAVPSSIIMSMQIPFTADLLGNIGLIFLVSAIFYAIAIAVGWFLPNILHAKKEHYGIMRYSVIFASTLFMGVPVISMTFGEMGVFYASIFNVLFVILAYTLGVWILLRKSGNDVKISLKDMITPPVIGIVIGLIFFFTSITIPEPFAGALTFLGGITVPLSFFVIGGFLANVRIKNIFNNYRLYIISLVSLLLIPFLYKIIAGCIITDPTIMSTTLILAAMPAAVNVVLLSQEFKMDSEFASQCVFIMTVISLITLPIIIALNT